LPQSPKAQKPESIDAQAELREAVKPLMRLVTDPALTQKVVAQLTVKQRAAFYGIEEPLQRLSSSLRIRTTQTPSK